MNYDEVRNGLDLPIKDLVKSNGSFLNDFLPGDINEKDPKNLLFEIVKSIKRADVLFNTPMEELIKKEMEEQREFLSRAEKSVIPEDKLYREKAMEKIEELNNWNPSSSASKHVKKKLIEKLSNDMEDYFADAYGITKPETEDEIKKRIEREHKHIIFIINHKKAVYHKALVCKKEIGVLTADLLENLELM